jgi:hypothetical protein
MSVRRLRAGEWAALLGAVALIVLLFLDWFSGPVTQSGWAGLGWFLDLLLVALALGGLAVAVTAMLDIAPAFPVGACVATGAAGVIITIVLAVVLLLQPGLGIGAPNDVVDVRLPAILGLVATALIPIGSFIALDDERADAPESAVVPPPARSAPEG